MAVGSNLIDQQGNQLPSKKDDLTEKIVMGIIFVMAGFTFAYFLGGLLRPHLNDSAHAIGILTMDGGVAFHPVQYDLEESIFGQFTLLLTAKVAPPVAGDMLIKISGPEQLGYQVSSRYPPGVPLFNRFQRWYSFENGAFKGMTSGSDLVVVIKITPPQAPGKYSLTISDENTQIIYFQTPVIFDLEGFTVSEEDCH